jgi:hypothetical protein
LVVSSYCKNGRNDRFFKAMQETVETPIGSLASRMYIHQARTEIIQEEIRAKMDAHHERMEVLFNVFEDKLKTEATDLDENPGKIEYAAKPEDAPKEGAAMGTVVALKEQYGDRH